MQRVGWIRTGALGDLLVGLASLRETLELWPNAKVTVVGPSLWLQILEPGAWPQIDRIFVLERKATAGEIYECRPAADGTRPEPSYQWTKVSENSSGLQKLRAEFIGYDVILNTRVDSPREGFPAFWSRVPERWGTTAGIAKFIYTHRGTHFGKDPLIHERDVPLLMMDEASNDQVGKRLRSLPSLREKIEASPRIAKWRTQGLPCPREFAQSESWKRSTSVQGILVNPTSSRREKAWPAASFRRILPAIAAMRREPVRVLGAPSETEWLKEVAGSDFDVVQPKNIGELFSVISQARMLLTNTSSVQFIAAATSTPTVTLMGRARPEVWGPLGPLDRVVRGHEPTRIEDLFERERVAYESIAAETVLAAIEALILRTEQMVSK